MAQLNFSSAKKVPKKKHFRKKISTKKSTKNPVKYPWSILLWSKKLFCFTQTDADNKIDSTLICEEIRKELE